MYTKLTLNLKIMCSALNHFFSVATSYKMTLLYLLVIIHINNQSTLYKVNGVAVHYT
jgi:hypothetical protein